MILIEAKVVQGTNLAMALQDVSYLANTVRVAVEFKYGDWLILVQHDNNPMDLYMVCKELEKIEDQLEHKGITFSTYKHMYDVLSEEQKQQYEHEYDYYIGATENVPNQQVKFVSSQANK